MQSIAKPNQDADRQLQIEDCSTLGRESCADKTVGIWCTDLGMLAKHLPLLQPCCFYLHQRLLQFLHEGQNA